MATTTRRETERERRHIQSKLASKKLWHPDDDVTELRADFATATLADFITKTLETAPPLKPEQVERVVSLIRAGGAG